MLSEWSVWLALLALAAGLGFPTRHLVVMLKRRWVHGKRSDDENRTIAMVAHLCGYTLTDFADQAYWAYARFLGMPEYLVYGPGALALKFMAAAMYMMLIWVYADRYRLLQTLGFPVAAFAAAVALAQVVQR